MARIEALLRERIGLNPESVGAANIIQAVRLRLRSLGVIKPADLELPAESLERYAARLPGDDVEFSELTEVVVVRNSWLFREPAAFAALRTYVENKRRHSTRIRLLSLGCAFGEEPVSIAVTLLDAGAPPCEITAVDISEEALRRARLCSFRAGSFPPESHRLRDQFFRAAGDHFEAQPEVGAMVRFVRGNAIDRNLLADGSAFDVVFCRNLLIYFDQTARQRTFENIDRLLKTGGLLIVGGVEAARLSSDTEMPHALRRFEGVATMAFTKQEATRREKTKERSREILPTPEPARRPAALAPSPASQTKRRPASGLLPLHTDPAGCWGDVGVLGGVGSCQVLEDVVTCLGCAVYHEHGRTLLDRPPPSGYAEACARAIAEPKEQRQTASISVTVFRLGGEWFALSSAQIQLVAPASPVHTVPFRSGRVFRGITNIGGALYLCVSLHAFLGVEHDTSEREPLMMVIGDTNNEWVFEADALDKITRCDPSTIGPFSSAAADARADFTRGMIVINERKIGLLDGEMIVASLRRAVS